MLIATVGSARLCDRHGRKPVMLAGVVGIMVFAYPMQLLVGSGSVLAYTVAVAVGQALQGVILGPYAAFLAELFPTRMRFTGRPCVSRVPRPSAPGSPPRSRPAWSWPVAGA
jgi:MHS family shikimate/dehydroshikimate transporter-like MFS transporter